MGTKRTPVLRFIETKSLGHIMINEGLENLTYAWHWIIYLSNWCEWIAEQRETISKVKKAAKRHER